MKKVGFFRSIQLKFIIIYILLLLVAMQVIGSYFAREIEEELLDNFYSSVDDRVDLLNYNLEQTFSRERDTDDGDPTLEQERSEEHTSELQSRGHLVCRLLLEKKKKKQNTTRMKTQTKHIHI